MVGSGGNFPLRFHNSHHFKIICGEPFVYNDFRFSIVSIRIFEFDGI